MIVMTKRMQGVKVIGGRRKMSYLSVNKNMALIPVFGKLPTGKRLGRILQSPHYSNGQFQNLTPTEVTLKEASLFKMLGDYRNRPADTVPDRPLPSIRTDLSALPAGAPVIVWFGHSSYLIKIDGFHILVDPVFSGNASPVSFFAKAFPGSDVYGVKDMPPIDLVLLTHDHYDHLDYKTILQLAPIARKFCTSLGVGSHLERWGIPEDKISELDWWERWAVGDLTLTATPARHFSGRGIKRAGTLWSSFVLQKAAGSNGKGYKLFLGGDSGYEQHFKVIGERYGPFDLAILECGQYGKNWPFIHMLPEETAAAAVDLGARYLLPVHWGKFTLSLHPWNEPIRRVVEAATVHGIRLTTPLIGEPVILDKVYPQKQWWDLYQ
jgi:L-ascorbate metabolism protein UlaG (beta-lactamase superfamily)